MKNNFLQSVQDKIQVIQDLLKSCVELDPHTQDSFLPQTEEVAALVDKLGDLVQLEARILARLGRGNGKVIPIDDYFQGAGDEE
jgi:hypothetical protein